MPMKMPIPKCIELKVSTKGTQATLVVEVFVMDSMLVRAYPGRYGDINSSADRLLPIPSPGRSFFT